MSWRVSEVGIRYAATEPPRFSWCCQGDHPEFWLTVGVLHSVTRLVSHCQKLTWLGESVCTACSSPP